MDTIITIGRQFGSAGREIGEIWGFETVGIAKTDANYIYDKFFRSRSASDNDIPGMGLGLAYIKQLVQAHRGNIVMESEEGVGTIFTINLPQ